MKFLTPLVSLLLLSLFPPTANATTLQGLTQAQLIEQADLIVQVSPISKSSQWRGGRIYTNYTVRVSEYLLGSGADSLELELLGGEINGIAQRVSGVPELPLQHARLLFLKKHPQHLTFTPIQLGLGIFHYDEKQKAWIPTTQDLRVLGQSPAPVLIQELRQRINHLRGHQ